MSANAYLNTQFSPLVKNKINQFGQIVIGLNVVISCIIQCTISLLKGPNAYE